MSSFEVSRDRNNCERPLFAQFIDESNLYAAYQRVLEKKTRGGIDQVSVDDFAKSHQANLRKLRLELESQQYTPEPVQAVAIPKFNEKNEYRQLGLPTVRDKIVQTAMLQVVEPLAEKLFLDTSYGYRKNKGHAKAIRRVEHYLSSKSLWVVHQDVDNFFDTLDHDRLLRIFARLVNNDQQMIDVVALWCRSGIVAKSGNWRNVETGVRQGQVMSPLLANLYLHDLDVHVQEKGWNWVRYADDYLALVQEESQAQVADIEIKRFLREELHLRLNVNAEPVNSLDKGFSFLGVLFQGDKREIAGKKISKMHNQIGWLLSPKNRSHPEKILRDLEMTVSGWLKYYGFLNPVSQFEDLEKQIENKFAELARQRIASSLWPEKPPTNLHLPLLLTHGDIASEGKKRLRKAWCKNSPNPTAETLAIRQADKKVGVRRRKHQREQVAEGEIIVTTPGHFVGRKGERIVVRRQQVIVAEIPSDRFTGLTLGEHGLALSTEVIRFCADKNITIHFMDNLGKIFAVANRPDSILADLLQKQIVHRDDQIGMLLARMFIWGKVKNQLALLKSFAKYRERRKGLFDHALRQSRDELESGVKNIRHLQPVGAENFRNTLLGLEGAFASRYWSLISMLIPQEYGFQGRERHGAKDLVNSLLNYGYGILYSQALAAVTKAGLSAMTGFLHASQGKKPVLTFDLIEEFRAPIVDRSILTMLNRREKLGQEDNGELDKATRKKVATTILARLGNEVVHRGKKDTLKNVLYGQATTIRDVLNGKSAYKPYVMPW